VPVYPVATAPGGALLHEAIYSAVLTQPLPAKPPATGKK
jgi:hypothetical protein